MCYYYYLYKLEINFIVIVIVSVYCLIIFAWFNYGDQPAPLSAINWTQVFIFPLRHEHFACEVQANWSTTFLLTNAMDKVLPVPCTYLHLVRYNTNHKFGIFFFESR